ncbi:hypothetical protein [Leptodesmis sp.]|uniref:hypothetical protein n=1 Tax=Leptodesmis sp. TaxID=3100501 RepID=UPI0040535B0B
MDEWAEFHPPIYSPTRLLTHPFSRSTVLKFDRTANLGLSHWQEKPQMFFL